MLRLGDVVSREGVDHRRGGRRRGARPCAGSACSPRPRARPRSSPARRARSARAANGDEVVDRIEAEAGRRRRRDQRARGGAADLRRDPRRGAARPGAGAVLRPRRRQRRDHGRRRLRAAVGGRASTSASPGSPPSSSAPTRSRRRDRRRLRAHLVDVLAPVAVDVGRVRAEAGDRQQRHARGPRRRWSRPGRDEPMPALPEPAHVRSERVPRRCTSELLASTVRASASGSRAWSPAGRPHRRRRRCSSPPRWSCSSFDELTISEWALREGIVLDAIGRHDPADWSDDPRAIRRASVQALARRCSWPEAHSRQVAQLALELFDQTARAARARRRRPRAARVRRAAARHRRARRARGPRPARGVPRAARPAARLRPRGDRRCSPRSCGGTAAASPKASDELVGPLDAERRERVRRLAALLRDRRRPRPQPQPGGQRVDVRVGPSLVLLRLHAERRRRARALGRAPQARALREGLRPRARAHRAPVG